MIENSEKINKTPDGKNIVIIYPGRFQPFHQGHLELYKRTAEKFKNVFVVTSNKVELPDSPFDFSEKKEIIKTHGIPGSRIIQAKSPYFPSELLDKFDSSNTVVIAIVSKKDMNQDARFTFEPKKDGSPSYFQPLPDSYAKLETFDTHSYIMTLPTIKFDIGRKGTIKSSSEFRELYRRASDKKRKKLVTALFDKYSKAIHELFNSRLNETVLESENLDMKKSFISEMSDGVTKDRGAIIPYYVKDGNVYAYCMVPSHPAYGGIHWQMAKGMIDDGETPMQAALREGTEELGMIMSNITDTKLVVKDQVKSQWEINPYTMYCFSTRVLDPDNWGEFHWETGKTSWVSLSEDMDQIKRTQRHYFEAVLRNAG